MKSLSIFKPQGESSTYIFISSFICRLSKHPLSSIGWNQRKPYYSHKLAQMRVSLETSIHQEGRTGGLRGQILGFLLMCSLLSVLPTIDGSTRASSLQQLQIGMYETRKQILSITLPLQCAFCMSLPSFYVSGVRTHYNREWEDNYTLKLYLFFKVICSKGVSVRPLSVAWNIEKFVSFLSAKYCVGVCVRVYLCVLAPPEYRWSIMDIESTE